MSLQNKGEIKMQLKGDSGIPCMYLLIYLN